MAEAGAQKKAGAGQPALSFLVGLAGWLVPGLGHLILRKWTRAVVYFLAVGALAWWGVALRGNIFSSSSTDAFDLLGFLADLGAGLFYFAARSVERAGPDVSRAAGDYGTRFFATAGVLNLLCVIEALQIVRGKKS